MSRPTFLTPFIGRTAELAEIEARLREKQTRLLTLTGPGGSGKTRLAHEVTKGLSEVFEDGTAWVDMVGLGRPEALPPTVATALEVRPAPGQSTLEALETTLHPRELLIVLDNCEHLVAACAELADALLRACPSLFILATSRARLGVEGEHIWPVPPLSHPEEATDDDSLSQFDAVRLFTSRARQVRPDFAIDTDNRRSLTQILRLLDGLPLAIELAAARVRAIEIPQMVGRLEDQLSFLSDHGQTSAMRHRSMRAAIRWSHEQLSEDEKILFRRLGVFAGGFSLDAVEAVCSGTPLSEGRILNLMDSLVQQSMIVRENSRAAETRFRLLEAIRQFALSKLREAEAEPRLRDRHMAYYASLVEKAEPHMFGPEQRAWTDRLDENYDNLQASLDWAFQKAVDDPHIHIDLARMVNGLFWLWNYTEQYEEAIGWFDKALALGGLERDTPLYADLARCRATVVWLSGDYPTARSQLRECLEIAETIEYAPGIAHIKLLLGILALHEGQAEHAISLLLESEALLESLGMRRELSVCRTNLGSAFKDLGQLETARSYVEEAVAGSRINHDLWGQGLGLQMLGSVMYLQGEEESALRVMDEALDILQRVGQSWLSAETLWRQAQMLRGMDDYEHAIQQLERCFDLAQEIGAMEWQLSALELLGFISLDRERTQEAAGYFGEVIRLTDGHTYEHIQARVLVGIVALAIQAGEWVRAARLWGAYEAVTGARGLTPSADGTRIRELIQPRLEREALADARREGQTLSLEKTAHRALAFLQGFEGPVSPVPSAYRLRLLALGPTEVHLDGRQLVSSDWTFAKPKELLYYLASNPPKTKEQIGLVFWPDASQDQLRAGLRAALYHLRRALGDRSWILYEDGYYRFNRKMDYWYDLEAFEAQVARGENLSESDPEQAIEALETAQKFYRGDFLADIAEDDWASLQRESLRRQYQTAMNTLGTLLMEADDLDRALEILHALLARDPLLEEAHRTLMRCYARKGERGLVLRQYQTLTEIMEDELGVEPSPESTSLYQSLIEDHP